MGKSRIPLFSLLVGLVAATACASAISDPFMVTSCAEKSLLWNTVTHETETIPIAWPEAASSARLVVSTGRASEGRTIELDDRTVSSVQVEFGRPEGAASERLIDLALTFFNAGGQPLAGETRTAQLGWVRGCGTGSFDLRPSDMAAASWPGMPSRGVLFLGGDVESFSTNGVDVAVDELPQAWWFKPSFSASKQLAMVLETADGTQYERTVFGIFPGFAITFR